MEKLKLKKRSVAAGCQPGGVVSRCSSCELSVYLGYQPKAAPKEPTKNRLPKTVRVLEAEVLDPVGSLRGPALEAGSSVPAGVKSVQSSHDEQQVW